MNRLRHRNRVVDRTADFADPASETLATEDLGTSISSGGDPAARAPYTLATFVTDDGKPAARRV
ncbi:hypothetical protein [Actinophytocola sp. KF-1]